jgi:hypothetical protein
MYEKRRALFQGGKNRADEVDKLISSIWNAEFFWAKLKRFFLFHA